MIDFIGILKFLKYLFLLLDVCVNPFLLVCYSASKPVNEEKSRSLGRKAVSTALLCLTGGVALSAVDDLAIYQGCSRYYSARYS